ncbi:MAG TPA: flagellar hook-basal body complex protein FliE [Burkholderiales bacterium]|jgi:flagellar hook-basal body complex protein FliE
MIDKISLTAPTGNIATTAAATGAPAANGASFGDILTKALNSVDHAQNESTDLAQKFQLGDPNVSLEDAMISMQKANVSFQAAVQVRNRLVSSYHDIMNMQV